MNMRVIQLDEVGTVKKQKFPQYFLKIGDWKEPIVRGTNLIELSPDICFKYDKIENLIEWVSI